MTAPTVERVTDVDGATLEEIQPPCDCLMGTRRRLCAAPAEWIAAWVLDDCGHTQRHRLICHYHYRKVTGSDADWFCRQCGLEDQPVTPKHLERI